MTSDERGIRVKHLSDENLERIFEKRICAEEGCNNYFFVSKKGRHRRSLLPKVKSRVCLYCNEHSKRKKKLGYKSE